MNRICSRACEFAVSPSWASSAAFAGVSRCLSVSLAWSYMDYILVSLLISSYLLLPSTFNLQPYFKLNINRILNKDYFYSDLIASGKYEFKMGLEIEGCNPFKSPRPPSPRPPFTTHCVSERREVRNSPRIIIILCRRAQISARGKLISPQNNYAKKIDPYTREIFSIQSIPTRGNLCAPTKNN